MVTRPNIEKGEGFIRTYDLLEHLIEDVYDSFRTLESNKTSQYLRRSTVRCVFSFIEALIQIIKHEIKSDIRLKKYTYQPSEKELQVIYEKLSGSNRAYFIPIEQNLKQTFSLATKMWNISDFILDLNNEGYSSLLRIKSTRNRLTHPRTFYDIQISVEEMSDLAKSFFWSKSEFLNLWRAKVQVIGKKLPKHLLDQLTSYNW